MSYLVQPFIDAIGESLSLALAARQPTIELGNDRALVEEGLPVLRWPSVLSWLSQLHNGGFVLREPFEQFDYLRTSRMSHVHSAIENCYVLQQQRE